jgi:uncharacterized protein (DUF885 family)
MFKGSAAPLRGAHRRSCSFPLCRSFLYNAFSDENMNSLSVILLSVGAALLTALAATPQQRSTSTPAAAASRDIQPDAYPQSELRGMIEQYSADRGSVLRFYDIPFSPARRNRMKAFYSGWLSRTERLNLDALSQDGRIDYLLFHNHLQHALRQLDIEAKHLSETEQLAPFAHVIIELEEARQQMQPIDSAKAAAAVDGLQKEVAATRKSIEASLKAEPPVAIQKNVAKRASGNIDALRKILKTWFGFYNGYDPAFTWWVAEPYKKADHALETYAVFLREKVVGIKPDDKETVVGDPIGREALLGELASEMIPYTPEELIAIANREMAWCEEEMKHASRELGYGDDWHKALEYVKTRYVAPGKQPGLIRDLAHEAVQFLDQHDLVTIPPIARETWRMNMMSPERQLINPFFTGGEVISVSYPTNGMTEEQKLMTMRGNNIHFSRATVFHELIPGHELQGYMAVRYRPWRLVFDTPFYVEGWSLYWELLFWDMKFQKSPEDRIGALFWRMHRCARIIFSLSFHLEKMSPQQAIDFLVDRVGHERDNAAGEVRRSFESDYSPLYQCAYLLGGLQIRALHRELVESGKMTNRAFHDAVLQENAIPIEMVRAGLTHQKVSRDFVSSWKFYGEKP